MDSFYRRLLDLISELTEIANDNDRGLEIEYDEDLKRVVLRFEDPQTWRYASIRFPYIAKNISRKNVS